MACKSTFPKTEIICSEVNIIKNYIMKFLKGKPFLIVELFHYIL